MKFFLGRKSTSFRTQRIVAKDVDLRPSAPKVLIKALCTKSICFLNQLQGLKIIMNSLLALQLEF